MAAGLGYKEFTTGDVLTAADANGYLASQVVMVFASAAARTSAIASPQEGMIAYLKDTNAVEKYDGAAWVAVAAAGGGKVAQVVSTTKTDTFSTTSTSYTDVTGLSVSITPTLATSKILVIVDVTGNGTPGTNIGGVKLLRGSTDIAYPTSFGSRLPAFASPFVNDVGPTAMASTNFLDSPATTSATTYKVQARTSNTGTIFINRGSNDGDNNSTVRSVSSITVMEILA
jgi:hypothetical protein